MIKEGILDKDTVINAFCSYLSDADVQDMMECNEFDVWEDEPDDSMDGDFDSAMASAGFGTDEDYGGCDERY
jgi:hypothetical protein